jgi:hypothetical protein
MKKWTIGLAALLCAVLLGSCGGFFTNSLGEKWARNPDTITVSKDNVKALLKESRGDPEASRGILDKIAEELKGNPNPDPVLQAAAVTAANQASGLGELILTNIGSVLDTAAGDGENTGGNTFNTLLDKVQKQAAANDIKGVSESATDSLIGAVEIKNGEPPVLSEEFVGSGVTDSDLTVLVFTLILGEVEQAKAKDPTVTFNSYITNTWGDGGKSLDATNTNGWTNSEKLIAAIGNQLAAGDSELGNMLKDLLGE